VYNVTLQTGFKPLLLGGGGGIKSVIRGDCEKQGGKFFKTFVPMTSKNSASVHSTLRQLNKGVTFGEFV
jgi:hypothetical protein